MLIIPAVIHITFETGAMRYRALEQALFVGSGRFILTDEGLKVEYRISKVCAGPGGAEESSSSG